MTAYGERSEDVRCPIHDSPLALLEEGVLNGVKVQYWGQCSHTDIRQLHVGTEARPCTREVRIEEATHTEPSLFGVEA